MKRRALFLLAALSGAQGFASLPTTTPAAGETAAQAADAAKAFSAALRRALGSAMAEGGPAAAVAVCHDEAPRIAARVSAEHGVRLGRVGVRSRNPANRLEGWQKALLQEWQARPPAGPPSQWAPVVQHEGGTLRWARAIETEGLCLVCHGPQLEPRLEASIRARYPDDPATGFEAGSLRGLLWVEVAAADR
ncbi:MAG: cytochrome c [Silanimonas sp.]|nr:MAG: cytochrome c [Silanimonas sp.]